MNLMFRKNFSLDKTGNAVGHKSKGGLGQGRNAMKRRDRGYAAMDDHHYKTHLFFTASRAQQNQNDSERCGPVIGAPTISEPLESSGSVHHPPLTRAPSFRIAPGTWRTSSSGSSRQKPLSLAALDRDCFVIPAHSLARFLPEGVPLPVPASSPDKINNNTIAKDPLTQATLNALSVLEVADPKLCILAHLMTPLEPIDPIVESPLAKPLLRQRCAAAELLGDVANTNTAIGGMLLANMEKNAEFPFISYYVINTTSTDPLLFYNKMKIDSLTKFDPKAIRYTAAHTLDLYSEVAMICRPPINDLGCGPKRSHTPSTGFIICVYKVFEGDDGERFERNWLYWTGARMLYRNLPNSVGLKKISLHKSVAVHGDKMYLLLCECSNLLDDLSGGAVLITALRARLCGYTGLYRPIQAF